MLTLLIALMILLTISIGFLTLSYLPSDGVSFKFFLTSTLFVTLASLALYTFTGNKIALIQWLTHGQTHYQLLQQFEALGGVKGVITRIEERLKKNPQDEKGKEILLRMKRLEQEEKIPRNSPT
jgi:hypothetical protein